MYLYILLISFVLFAAYWLRFKRQGGVCTSNERLCGKTVLITGGNAGIGRETAVDLARRGAKVYIACRSESKGLAALEYIKQASGSDTVFLTLIDLACFDSIKKCAQEFLSTEKSLHILINNAGLSQGRYMKTEAGLEMNFGVNHIGPFLFTNLLMDRLKECAPSRIVNVASVVHSSGKIDFQNLNLESGYTSMRGYANSKLANVLFTLHLSKILDGSGVSAFCLHPGAVYTDIFSSLFRFVNKKFTHLGERLFRFLLSSFFKTPSEGAQTSIYCAVQHGIEEYTGKYFVDCQMRKASPVGCDEEVAAKLWEVSANICGI